MEFIRKYLQYSARDLSGEGICFDTLRSSRATKMRRVQVSIDLFNQVRNEVTEFESFV